LDNRRHAQQKRLAQYKQLESLLEPFKNPQENIQPNLVTRDGELVREIDRMRMLVARVAGRINNTRVIQTGDVSDTIPSTDPEDRLAALLDTT
jgi:Kinetochore complex Fta4 of Sim4 subunit, or CENP-50